MSTGVAIIVSAIIKGYVELRLLTIEAVYTVEIEKYEKHRNKKLSYSDPGSLHDWIKTQAILFRSDTVAIYRKTKLTPGEFETICKDTLKLVALPAALTGLRLAIRQEMDPHPWHKYPGCEIRLVND